MAEFASPGVIATERDFSASVQMLGTATGGTVINSKWGFVDQEMVCGNEQELVSQAGKPTDVNYRDWFVAANFLKYTSALRWVRVVDEETAKNATAGGVASGILIKNEGHLDVVRSVGASLTHHFAAKCPSDLGNSIQVEIADSTTYAEWDFANLFDTAPGSSGPLSGNAADALDEIHLVVVDKLGLFSGTPGSVLETYPYLSKARDAKGVDGESSYYINVLNARSEYVWGLKPVDGDNVVEDADSEFSQFGGTLTSGKPFVALSAAYSVQFAGGSDGTVPTKDAYI